MTMTGWLVLVGAALLGLAVALGKALRAAGRSYPVAPLPEAPKGLSGAEIEERLATVEAGVRALRREIEEAETLATERHKKLAGMIAAGRRQPAQPELPLNDAPDDEREVLRKLIATGQAMDLQPQAATGTEGHTGRIRPMHRRR